MPLVVAAETSRDFAALLPLTLTLKDYAATEKISDLPKRLSTDGAPLYDTGRRRETRSLTRAVRSPEPTASVPLA
jgi:hypothetical protein